MHEPELLILDEPIADDLVQQSFHPARRVCGRRPDGLSSHTLSEVERVAHRVAIIRRGRLVVVDSLENLRAVAAHKLEIEFVGAAPSADDFCGRSRAFVTSRSRRRTSSSPTKGPWTC